MQVRDVLKGKKGADLITIGPAEDVAAAVNLLNRHRIGGLPVVRPGGTMVGFVSERHIVRAVDERDGEIRRLPVSEIMDRPAPVCSDDEPLRDVMARMTRKRLRHLVVTDGEEIAGIISVGDLVKHRMEQLETEAGILRDVVAGQRASR